MELYRAKRFSNDLGSSQGIRLLGDINGDGHVRGHYRRACVINSNSIRVATKTTTPRISSTCSRTCLGTRLETFFCIFTRITCHIRVSAIALFTNRGLATRLWRCSFVYELRFLVPPFVFWIVLVVGCVLSWVHYCMGYFLAFGTREQDIFWGWSTPSHFLLQRSLVWTNGELSGSVCFPSFSTSV